MKPPRSDSSSSSVEVEVAFAERVKFRVPVWVVVVELERLVACIVRTKAPLGSTEVRESERVVEVFVRGMSLASRFCGVVFAANDDAAAAVVAALMEEEEEEEVVELV